LVGRRFLEEVRLTNLLSYGPDTVPLRLEPLNVLIGPNASGKSNLIEALSLLAAAPRDLLEPFRKGGGVEEWIWKGKVRSRTASIEVTVLPTFRYRLSFASAGYRLRIVDEVIELMVDPAKDQWHSLYEFRKGNPAIDVGLADEVSEGRGLRPIREEDISFEQSIFSQRKDPSLYHGLTLMGQDFGRMRFYKAWDVSRDSVLRRPQQADLPNEFLEEDGANLALILSDLQNRPNVKKLLLEKLQLLYRDVSDVHVKPQGGTVQIFFHERGLETPVPATRLSDGTLRFLCLLAVLCHPDPPPLVCIEEPELGLHPDAIAAVAELLLDAARRTQLVVTTHSDALVSALSEVPEAIVVCERTAGRTRLHRLESEKLERWLQNYQLGELWRMGEIGGTRW